MKLLRIGSVISIISRLEFLASAYFGLIFTFLCPPQICLSDFVTRGVGEGRPMIRGRFSNFKQGVFFKIMCFGFYLAPCSILWVFFDFAFLPICSLGSVLAPRLFRHPGSLCLYGWF